jgi:hypothetical protein
MTLHANASTFGQNQTLGMLLGAGLLFCGFQLGKSQVAPTPFPLPARVVPCAAVQACPHQVVAAPSRPLTRTTAAPRGVDPEVKKAATPLRPVQAPAPAAPQGVNVAGPAPQELASACVQPAQPWGEEPYPKARPRRRADGPPRFGPPRGYGPEPSHPAPPGRVAEQAPPPFQRVPPDAGGWNPGGWNGGPPGDPRSSGAPGWSGGPPLGPPPDESVRGPMGPPPGFPRAGGSRPSSYPTFEGGRPPGY